MPLDPLPGRTLGRRAANLLRRIVLVLVHPNVIDLILHIHRIEHVAKSLRKAARLLVILRVAVEFLARTARRALARKSYYWARETKNMHMVLEHFDIHIKEKRTMVVIMNKAVP